MKQWPYRRVGSFRFSYRSFSQFSTVYLFFDHECQRTRLNLWKTQQIITSVHILRAIYYTYSISNWLTMRFCTRNRVQLECSFDAFDNISSFVEWTVYISTSSNNKLSVLYFKCFGNAKIHSVVIVVCFGLCVEWVNMRRCEANKCIIYWSTSTATAGDIRHHWIIFISGALANNLMQHFELGCPSIRVSLQEDNEWWYWQ